MKKAVYPKGSKAAAADIKVSPAIISGNHVFLTGLTGSRADGSISLNLEEQFREAFDKISATLDAAGVGFDTVVEMTSYHVGLRDHFELFNEIRSEYVSDPYPAWTAVEVAGLRREGAVVEIRIIASTEDNS